ncbi:MAG: hypothetical protein ACRDZR_14370 [Acidimicrobiales bacterium]
MTASSVDTAELYLPRIGRIQLRRARRQRQRYAVLGVAVMVLSLAMTVVVLDVVR